MKQTAEDYKDHPGQYEIYVASGEQASSDLIVALLYRIIRDHLAPGQVEEMVQQILDHSDEEEVSYTNGWLMLYVENILSRLRDGSTYQEQ